MGVVVLPQMEVLVVLVLAMEESARRVEVVLSSARLRG